MYYTMTEGWQLAVLDPNGYMYNFDRGYALVPPNYPMIYYNDGATVQSIGNVTLTNTSGSQWTSPVYAWRIDNKFRLATSGQSANNPWTGTYNSQYLQGRLFWI